LHNRDDWKVEKFPSSFPFRSLKVDWREREMVNSKGLEDGFRVKFVKVCEGFDGVID